MAITHHRQHMKAARPAPPDSADVPPRFGIRTATLTMQAVPFWKVLNLKASADAAGPGGLHLVGTGEVDYSCGRCQRLLASHLDRGDLTGTALMCPDCHHWNRAPES